jgi:exonuclease VII small subunit
VADIRIVSNGVNPLETAKIPKAKATEKFEDLKEMADKALDGAEEKVEEVIDKAEEKVEE